jgi:hypothetical protein
MAGTTQPLALSALASAPIRIRPLSLRFSDPALERDFRAEWAAGSILDVRLALALGLVLFAAFGALDQYILPEVLAPVRAIRFGIVCPIGAIALLLTLGSRVRDHLQAVAALSVLTAGGGLIAMMAIATGPGRHDYYAGLLLVAMFAFTLTRLRFPTASITSLTLTVTYIGSLLAGPATPVATVVNNLMFLGATNVVGMFAAYTIERTTRQDFLQRRVIAEQTAHLADALASVKVLNGLLPICAWCHKIRDDDGYWQRLEAYVTARSDAQFSHGICPDCAARVEPAEPVMR